MAPLYAFPFILLSAVEQIAPNQARQPIAPKCTGTKEIFMRWLCGKCNGEKSRFSGQKVFGKFRNQPYFYLDLIRYEKKHHTQLRSQRQAKKNGTFPIFLRATQDGCHFKMVTQAYVTHRKHFNTKAPSNGWIATKEPMAKVFNTHLSDTLERAYRTMSTLQQQSELTAQSLIQTLKQREFDEFQLLDY